MSNVLNALKSVVATAVESAVMTDMSIASVGGQGGKLYPEGYAFGRLVAYVEIGDVVQEFQGEVKSPAPHMFLGFAIWGAGYQNEDGSPGYITTYDMSLSNNGKAKAFKLFKKLNWKGEAKNFAQLLSDGFLVKIVHHTSKAPGSKPKSIIDIEGFLPPIDVVSQAPYTIADAPDSLYKLFLWDNPTPETWATLFIDGKREDGTSKNWLQDKVMAATNFVGSPLDIMLGGVSLPSMVATTAPTAPVTAPTVAPTVPVVAPAVAAPTAAVVPTAPVVQPTAVVVNVPNTPVVVAPVAVPVAPTVVAPVVPVVAAPPVVAADVPPFTSDAPAAPVVTLPAGVTPEMLAAFLASQAS
jgi:hypothetical protein